MSEDPFSSLDDVAEEQDQEPTGSSESDSNSGSRLGGSGSDMSREDLPYIFRRENAKDGREPVTAYLQETTNTEVNEFVDELEDHFGTNVSKFDVEEAALLVAIQQHPKDVAEKLGDWGYDLK
jgi:hypothetical protein